MELLETPGHMHFKRVTSMARYEALQHHENHSTFTLAGLVAALEGPLDINIYCILIERSREKHLRGVRGVPIRPWGAAGGTLSPKDLATGPSLSITWRDN